MRGRLGSIVDDILNPRTYVLVVALLGVIFILELVVALNLDVVQAWVSWAMWSGALFWVVFAVLGWVVSLRRSDDEFPIWLLVYGCLILTALAVISVLGIYQLTFVTFALWENVAISLIYFVMFASGIPDVYRGGVAVPVQTKR